jgi:iron complex outermembrane receptor protein
VKYLGYENYQKEVQVEGSDIELDIEMKDSPFLTDEVVVETTRLSPKAPATFKNIDRKEIEKLNLGQDLPILLKWTPSVVTTSDAGAGVGYTGLRIRGSDQTRINVTVNGIPINDAESQGVFWVNMPDLASSLSSVQIQRGLGTSTNGSGAFGASINMETNSIDQEKGGQISNSFGSFNTRKHTVEFNSGRMENGFAIDGRLSQIKSDGYIDRASSDLKSYYLSGGYYGEKTVVKAITFAGKERTYQSWFGTPESRIENDREGMLAHAAREGYTEEQTENLLNSGRTYNYYLYENQVDNYEQQHYQLHLIRELMPNLKLTLAGHYTYGSGYFEEFRRDDEFADYGKPNPTFITETVINDQPYFIHSSIPSTDLIRRRWLDNDFYGATYALNYKTGRHEFILGGGLHFYRGDHFGEIVWAESSETIDHLERYYEGVGNKDDISVYGKWNFDLDKWNFMADLQLRSVRYTASGIDNDQSEINVSDEFLFFNPKVGVRYQVDNSNSLYAYAGIGNREPTRNDYLDAPTEREPTNETLYDIEAGYTHSQNRLRVNANGYYMIYRNQWVLTGELNDVGAQVRSNAGESYRLGIELDAQYALSDELSIGGNATLSRNKIESYNEIIGGDVNTYDETDISFSPSVISAGRIGYRPVEGLEINLISKYVGKQYLDNTQSEARSLDAYWVNDVRLAYTIENVIFDEIQISLLVNNFLDEKYSSNGYTYSYFFERKVTENFYYPQAGINFLAGLTLGF